MKVALLLAEPGARPPESRALFSALRGVLGGLARAHEQREGRARPPWYVARSKPRRVWAGAIALD
jgi:hypothetical protein